MVQRYPLINGKSGEELTLPNSSSVIRLRGLPCPDPHTAQESVGGMEGWEKCFKSNWEPDPGETGMCVAWGLGQEWKLPPPSPPADPGSSGAAQALDRQSPFILPELLGHSSHLTGPHPQIRMRKTFPTCTAGMTGDKALAHG